MTQIYYINVVNKLGLTQRGSLSPRVFICKSYIWKRAT